MTAVLFSLLLSTGAVAADTPAPAAEPAAAAPAPAPPREPWYRTLANDPRFGRGFSVAVLVTGGTLFCAGLLAAPLAITLRATDLGKERSPTYRDNLLGLSTLVMLTGLVLGGVLAVGGTVGIVLL